MRRLVEVQEGDVAHASDLNQYYDLFHGGQVHDVVATYGASGDGNGDDAPAIQAAIDAAMAAGGGTILLQTGTYALGRTLNVANTTNIRMQGLGSTGQNDHTVLRWDGASGGTVLFIDQVRDSIFEGFSILNGTNGFGVGIDADQRAPTPITTNLTFRELDIDGGTIAGMRLANSNMGNNDLHKFENVQFIGPGPAGLIINNVNSKGHILWGGTFSHKSHGIKQINGSFHCFGSNFESNGTDIYLSNVTDTISVYGIQSENSRRFLETLKDSPAWAVVVIGSRIVANKVHEDGNFVVWQFGGPLTFLNNDFATAAHISSARFFIQGSGTPSLFNAIGNVFPNRDVFASVNLAIGHVLGNRYIDASNKPQLMDDFYGPYGAAELQNFKISKHFVLGADFVHSSQAPAFSSTYTPDPTRGEHVMMSLTEDITVGTPVNAARGQELTFVWTQDATGSRRITYDHVYKTGGVPALVTRAGSTTIDRFCCVDNTTWRLVSRVTGQ